LRTPRYRPESQEAGRVSATPSTGSVHTNTNTFRGGQRHHVQISNASHRRGHHGRALEEAIASQKAQWPRSWNGANPLSGSRNFHTMSAVERVRHSVGGQPARLKPAKHICSLTSLRPLPYGLFPPPNLSPKQSRIHTSSRGTRTISTSLYRCNLGEQTATRGGIGLLKVKMIPASGFIERAVARTKTSPGGMLLARLTRSRRLRQS